MGQRHQIILVLPEIYYNPNNPNNHGVELVAVHHQWLYGEMAVHMLRNFLGFYHNSKQGNRVWAHTKTGKMPYGFSHKEEAEDTLKAVYSLDIHLGYYHRTHGLDYVHPDTFDNNDGCTMIDLRNPDKPKYCFFSINGLEGNKDFPDDMKPYTAKKYMECYTDTPDDDDLRTLAQIDNMATKMTQKEFDEIIKIAKEQDKKKEEQEKQNEK